MRSGYKTITPIQLANGLSALDEGKIGARELRVYFACLALVAVREAARRSRPRRREREVVRYRLEEVKRLAALRAVKSALRRLERVGLLVYSEAAIDVASEPLAGSDDLLEALRCGRSPRRPIPMPRAVLRFLASNCKAALTKTMLAYIVRGLALSRNGAVAHKGTVKVSWIADTFGLSERAVRYARAQLIGLGWIGKDTGSRQRKLNRDGAYFAINLDWSPPVERQRRRRPARRTIFAPPPPQKCTAFAPPKENKKTSYEDKNQGTQGADPSGVCKGELVREREPTLRNVVPEDLRSVDRLEALYVQAVGAGWIQSCEAQALDFLAAAVRARQAREGDPVRIFVATLRQGLWHHITQAQEDQARRSLARFREENPDRFRLLTTPNRHPRKVILTVRHQLLSTDPHFVRPRDRPPMAEHCRQGRRKVVAPVAPSAPVKPTAVRANPAPKVLHGPLARVERDTPHPASRIHHPAHGSFGAQVEKLACSGSLTDFITRHRGVFP